MPEPTPEQIGREAGEAIANAIADTLESVLLKMADAIAKVQAEQARQANDLRELRQHIAGVARVVDERTAHLA